MGLVHCESCDGELDASEDTARKIQEISGVNSVQKGGSR